MSGIQTFPCKSSSTCCLTKFGITLTLAKWKGACLKGWLCQYHLRSIYMPTEARKVAKLEGLRPAGICGPRPTRQLILCHRDCCQLAQRAWGCHTNWVLKEASNYDCAKSNTSTNRPKAVLLWNEMVGPPTCWNPPNLFQLHQASGPF